MSWLPLLSSGLVQPHRAATAMTLRAVAHVEGEEDMWRCGDCTATSHDMIVPLPPHVLRDRAIER